MKLDLTIYGSFGFSFLNVYTWLESLQLKLVETTVNDIHMWLGIIASLLGLVALIIKTYMNYKERNQEYRHAEEERAEQSKKAVLEQRLLESQIVEIKQIKTGG